MASGKVIIGAASLAGQDKATTNVFLLLLLLSFLSHPKRRYLGGVSEPYRLALATLSKARDSWDQEVNA